MRNITSSMIILMTLLTSGCYQNARDAQEPHQIVAEPKNRWVYWQQEAPIDVSQERVISKEPCSQIP